MRMVRHSVVPEEQLNDKITEYAEYIKIGILAIMILAIGYFIVRSLLKKSRKK